MLQWPILGKSSQSGNQLMRVPISRFLSHTAAVAIACLFATRLHAQTITATKTVERTIGERLVCVYEGAGREYYRSVKYSQLCPQTIRVASRDSASSVTTTRALAIKTGETVAGSLTVCRYEFGGREYTQAVENGRLCPRSLRVR